MLVVKYIEAGMSPWDIEERLLDLGFPSTVIGVAFERVANELRDRAKQLMLEASVLDASRRGYSGAAEVDRASPELS